MKVIFLFMSSGSANPDLELNDNWKKQKCGIHYQRTFGDECYFKMLETLVNDKVITDLKVFYESNVSPGKAEFVKGADCYVVPHISQIDEFVDDDTIIFVRGGFKHWHDWLLKYKGTNWLVCYAANTGRDRWCFWDVIFDDLGMKNSIDRQGRYHFPFIKPTNEDVFYPSPIECQIEWDVCIGASHIHDKKGQYHGVNLLKAYKEKYGITLRSIMPGSPRRSMKTLEMLADPFIREVEMPSMVPKPYLSSIYDQVKVFLHLGTCGQNDRSVIEAYACGIPVILRNPKAHSPLMCPNDDTLFRFDLDNDPDYEKSVTKLHEILENWDEQTKNRAYLDYTRKMGYELVVIPALSQFFRILSFEGKPSMSAKEHLIHAFGKEEVQWNL